MPATRTFRLLMMCLLLLLTFALSNCGDTDSTGDDANRDGAGDAADTLAQAQQDDAERAAKAMQGGAQSQLVVLGVYQAVVGASAPTARLVADSPAGLLGALELSFGTGVEVEQIDTSPPTYLITFAGMQLGVRQTSLSGRMVVTVPGDGSTEIELQALEIGSRILNGTLTLAAGEGEGAVVINGNLSITDETNGKTATLAFDDVSVVKDEGVITIDGVFSVQSGDSVLLWFTATRVTIDQEVGCPTEGSIELISDTFTLRVTFNGTDHVDVDWGLLFEHSTTVELPCGVQGITVGWHVGGAWTIAWQPDGTCLGSGGQDGLVQIWNLSTRRPSQTLRGHGEGVTSIDWSADGSTIVSVGLDETIRTWSTETWNEIDSLVTPGTVNAVTFSPDGTHIAGAAQDGTVRIWEITDQQKIRLVQTLTGLTGHHDRVLSVAWSDDGNTLASGSVDQTIKLWDLSGGAASVTLLHTLIGHAGEVTGLVFFPDGALGSVGRDKTIIVWDTVAGSQDLIGRGEDMPFLGYLSLALDPKDGTSLAAGCDDSYPIVHWHREANRMVSLGYTYPFNGDDTNAVAFRPNTDGLASASADGGVRVLPYWAVLNPDGIIRD